MFGEKKVYNRNRERHERPQKTYEDGREVVKLRVKQVKTWART